MSLHHSSEGNCSRKILQAVAGAIRLLEMVTESTVGYDISKDDAVFLCSALSDLWTILYSNGYTIDIETNRLRRSTS